MTPPPAIIALRARATDWAMARSPRERLLLAGLAALALGTVLVAGVWRPIQVARAQALLDIRTYEAVAARARAAPPPLPGQMAARQGPVSAIVTDTAAQAGLTIRRLEPEAGRTQVALEDADFEKVVRWLDALERTGRLRIETLKLERRPPPGVVNVQLTLAGG